MNAQSPALVASRPERLRLVGQRRQLLRLLLHSQLLLRHNQPLNKLLQLLQFLLARP